MSESKRNDESGPRWKVIDFNEIEVGERISGGGVGEIHLGKWNGKEVALKTLFDPRINEDLKQEFMNELIVMSRLKHSNIVSLLGASTVSPNLCIVMELCEYSVSDMLYKEGIRPSSYDIVQMMLDVASAMEYLHAQKPAIIHRDLKTLNILKAFDGSLKICDFGLVNTRSPTAGTPPYMPPELFRGQPYNKSVDTYSFGILFWEVSSGRQPFGGYSVADIRDKVLRGDRPSLTGLNIPRRCIKLIQDCWADNNNDRPDFGTIVDELIDISKTENFSSLTENSDFDDSFNSIVKDEGKRK